MRRELTPDELRLAALLDGAAAPWRSIVSAGRIEQCSIGLPLGTGLAAASSLRSLTSQSFDLDAELRTVTVAAAYSKRNGAVTTRAAVAERLGGINCGPG